MAGAIAFVAVLALAGAYSAMHLRSTMRAEAQTSLERFARLRDNMHETFAAMHETVTAEPCSPEFQHQLRRIAYRPDGLNEFLYAPAGVVVCTVNVPEMVAPMPLGTPDIAAGESSEAALWIDRDLDFLDLDGMRGTIALSDPFATVIPRRDPLPPQSGWVDTQMTLVTDDRWWHRGGTPGVYRRHRDTAGEGATWLGDDLLRTRLCTSEGLHCVTAEARHATLWARGWPLALVVLVTAGLAAAFAATQTRRFLRRYWSFEARFSRQMDGDRVVCLYQPVMSASSGAIVGCEVLARWRDLDGSLITPDRFLDILRRRDLTMDFTRLVVERAHRELAARLPHEDRLTVSFNVFPRDLDSAALVAMLAPFAEMPERFAPAIEIIESDALPLESAGREIAALRAAGIGVYIDDFGVGYCNVQNLAELEVNGVKLDRSFAMAPKGSVMARMLHHAVEMIATAGHRIVVEGIETAERLASVRRLGNVACVQGYHIARPLDASAFADFLVARRKRQRRKLRRAA